MDPGSASIALRCHSLLCQESFSKQYERDYNIFNPASQYAPDNPFNPANRYNPNNP